MADKLIITFDEYNKIVEKLAIEIHKKYKPTVLVGIMRGAAPILDILSRILKLPTAYIVIQSYSGEGMEDKQGQLMFAREISSLAESKDYNKVLLVDDLSDTGLTLNKSIEWLKNYGPTKDYINEVKTACLWKKASGDTQRQRHRLRGHDRARIAIGSRGHPYLTQHAHVIARSDHGVHRCDPSEHIRGIGTRIDQRPE